MNAKTRQLQIRVTPEQKAELKRRARRVGMDVSAYVLARVLPPTRGRFTNLLSALRDDEEDRYVLAELNDLLAALAPIEFHDAVGDADLGGLSPLLRNYVAAMVEQAAHQKRVAPPGWVHEIEPLAEPYFATPLRSLRPHLLRSSPVPFKRRNLFVDSGVGDRV